MSEPYEVYLLTGADLPIGLDFDPRPLTPERQAEACACVSNEKLELNSKE
jgi:hypothetical protein